MTVARRRTTFRRVSGLAAVMLSALILLNTADRALAQTRIVLGTAGGYGDSSAAVRLASERGFFKEAGIDAEVVDFKGGAPAVQALIGGGINYCICAPEHVIRLRNKGIGGYVAFALDTRHTYVLLAKSGSTAHGFGDLRGKRVGITSSGSLTESLIRLQAQRSNLDPDKDIEIVGSGVGAAMKAAIDSGRIEAGMFGNLDAELLLRQGYQIVFDWRTQQIPSLALLSTTKWRDSHPESARAVVQAVRKAQQLLLDDKAVALQTLKEIYPTLDASVLEADASNLPNRLSRDGIYDVAAFDRLQADLLILEPNLKLVAASDALPTDDLK